MTKLYSGLEAPIAFSLDTDMRYQGRITTWNDDKGFGFITRNGGSDRIFFHVHDMATRDQRPVVSELVTYELGTDARNRPRACKVAYVHPRVSPSRERHGSWRATGLSLLILALAGGGAWQQFRPAQKPPTAEEPVPDLMDAPVPGEQFRCEGKRRCPEMRSCAEAIFYLQNCPGVEIDGDRDGIPCEDQWCSPGRR